MPELLVQHAINSAYSVAVGMKKENIALSTVPPTAPPAPKLYIDLPYAVALRDFFLGYKFRAQQNTRYMGSDTAEATITHVLDTIISRLTSADIQSTITPDEGRNVPWHYNNILGVNTARQTLMGVDGLMDMVSLESDGPLPEKVREIKERAVLFLEEIVEIGGYFAAVEQGYFVDSGNFPERRDDGIAREADGGVSAGSIIRRADDYMAPVCSHFGENHLPGGIKKPCDLIDGCSLCDPEKIVFIDELDDEDNVTRRLDALKKEEEERVIRPEVEWAKDGIVCVTLFIPESEEVAEAAALVMAEKMGLESPEVIHKRVMHPAEGTLLEVKGRLSASVRRDDLVIPPKEELVPEDEISDFVRGKKIALVAATVGEDEHSVGMREIIDIKHGGLEKYGFVCHYLGTSVPVAKVLDAAKETGSEIVLISTIITHNDIHKINMQRLSDLAVERGMRDTLILIAGGTQVTDDSARESGMDAGFGRGTKGHHVASYVVKRFLKEKRGE
jgi:D-ornithine 4,5-aminomutase subunit beta